MSRSPWKTWMSTDGWLSSAVVKTSERFVGIVVLRSMILVMMPPLVSMPRDSGVTSSSRTSLTSPLRTPACIADALHRDLVLGQVDAVRGLHLADQPVDDALVPVVTTEVVVAAGRLDLDDALTDLEQGHVERAAAEVEDEDRLLLVALVEAVGQGGRGRLVDDPAHVEARDLAGLLGGLALRVGEVRRNGDDRIGHRLAEVRLGVALELLQHERADLLGGEVLVVDLRVPVGAHVALDRPDGALDVGDGLALGDLADEDLAGLGEGHDRRGGTRSFGVGDDGGLSTFQDGDDAVGRSEVD